MPDIGKSILDFRNLLERTLQAQQGGVDEYAQGVATVTRTLLADYDRIFKPSILQQDSTELQELIDRFCYKSGCPICGTTVKPCDSEKELCIKDDCTGMIWISSNGFRMAVINDTLRFFLTRRLNETTLKEQEEQSSRFRNLDI